MGLNSVANQVRNLDTALKSVDGFSADKIDKLSNSLSKLKGLGSIKISSSIGNQLKNISTAASALKGADLSGINKLSAAIQPLSSIGKASGLQSAITQLQKLPQLAQTLNSVNWATLTSQLQQLSNALAPLANQLNTVSTAFTRLPTNIRSVVIGTILVVTGANVPLGLGLMAVGAVGLASVVIENWDYMSERLAKTLTTVTSILAGFLLAIGAFLAFSGVNVPLGAGLMVAGAVALGTAVAINWKFLNGDLKNALSILTGIVSGALLAMGALFAFTGVDAPLGIALMVAGAVGLATSIGLNWDSMSDPLRRTIGLLEGIVGGALLALGAILAFTGANIPLGVGMIAAGAISLVSAVALNWNSLSGGVQDSINSIVAIISGAALGIGAVLALSGVATGLGVALLAAGAVGLATTVGLNWNSMTDEVRSTVTKILVIVGAAALAIGAILAFTGVGTALGVGLMLAGAASLATAVALNWNSLVEKIKSVTTKILIIAGTAALAIGLILVFTGVGIPLGLGLILAGAGALGSAAAMNWDSIVDTVSGGLKKVGLVIFLLCHRLSVW